MNKRIDKKKQKRTLESAVTATATSSAPATERVIADCNAKGHAVENPEALSIYLKPEDKKAYYTLGGFNGYIEL